MSGFLAQLAALRRTHDIVPLEAALAPRTEPKPRAVITFDDAYRGAVTLALPVLAREHVPATVFVSPGLLGDESVWWDELAEAGRLTEQNRTEAMFEHHGRAAEVRASALGGARRPALPRSYGVSTMEELSEQTTEGIAVAAHGWDHACLPSLDAEALRTDLADTLAWVRGYPGGSVPWLALPYGEGSPTVSALALDLGYEGVLEIRGGLWNPGAARSSVPRVNVPAGLSRRGLALRTSGLRS